MNTHIYSPLATKRLSDCERTDDILTESIHDN